MKKLLYLILIFLLLFSCSSAESQIARIRVLEKRVTTLESQENAELKKLSNQLKKSLTLLSQQLNDINTDRERSVNDLEEIKITLERLEGEIRLLKLKE